MLLQGSHRPGKIWPWSWKKSAFCSRIVLEFCKIILENMNLSLKKIKKTTSPLRFMGCVKKLCENRKKNLNENRSIYVKERGATRIFVGELSCH